MKNKYFLPFCLIIAVIIFIFLYTVDIPPPSTQVEEEYTLEVL